MKLLFRHFVLLAVMLGLAGQSAAFAATPCPAMQMEQGSAPSSSMAGMPDCDMSQHKTDPHKSDDGSAPCKEMTPRCLAMAVRGPCGSRYAVANHPGTAPRREPQSLAHNASSAGAQHRARSRSPFPPWLNPLRWATERSLAASLRLSEEFPWTGLVRLRSQLP
jgi:hypothetical protein